MKAYENRAAKRNRLKARGQDFSGQLTSNPEDQDSTPVIVPKKIVDKENALRGLISFLTIPYRKRQLIMLSVIEWLFLPLCVFVAIFSIPVIRIDQKINSLKNSDDNDRSLILIFFMSIGLIGYGYITLALPRWYSTGENPFNDTWKFSNFFLASFFTTVYFFLLLWCGTGIQVERSLRFWNFPSTVIFRWFEKILEE